MLLEETVCVELTDDRVGERDRRVPAYLMPFIQSDELGEYLKTPEATAEHLIMLLSQAAEAICYLHGRGLVHLDIKPANILVAADSPGQPRALLSDFGFCKRVVVDSQETLVMGTDGYIDPDLLLLMTKRTASNENRVRDRVPRNELRSQFDRYALGATILDSIITFLEGSLGDGSPRTMPTGLLRGLLFVALRCSGRNPLAMRTHAKYPKRATAAPMSLFRHEVADAFAYTDSDDMRADLALLRRNRLAFLEPEIAETTGEAVCLPERMFVPLSERVVRTIDSIMVRRLATISQLALCYHVYPGACHTRKEHVLGAYRATCRLLRQLILDPANPIGAMILKRPQQRLAMAATLLHDIAHIPLMHEFEDSVPELSQRAFTSELLQGDWGGDTFFNDLKGIFALWGVDLDDVRLVLGKRDKVPYRLPAETASEAKERWEREWERADIQLVRSIIDGPVDADKIDYLQRDALHAGVRFGHGVDVERIETQMTTVVEAEGSGKGALKVRCRMGAWEKGQAAAESLIAVRRSMYSQVYAHRTVRAGRSMLNYVVWKWRTAKRYDGHDGDEISRDLFGFASSLGTSKAQMALFALKPAEVNTVFIPKVTDNLPYHESRVIRWMAIVSGDDAAAAMAEALISRNLYRQVCSLVQSDAPNFFKLAFSKKNEPILPARHWLEFTEHLYSQLKASLSGGGTSIVFQIEDNLLPPLLLDISIPKTMRTQPKLSIVRDLLASGVTWGRVARLEGETLGVVTGAAVYPSPMYEAYGGSGQEDSLEPIVIRLFARGDLAHSLRPQIDRRVVSSWLEAFRPDE